jgi:AsmA protein
VVQGPWDDPLVFPDPESLIRRSKASAPLLDAVRDRKTRDAVRSMIEHLTDQKAVPEATVPDAPTGTSRTN